MMCPHMEATLNEYVDGTLAARERATVEAHLIDCAGCGHVGAPCCKKPAGSSTPAATWPS